jgi:hypothetical protein
MMLESRVILGDVSFTITTSSCPVMFENESMISPVVTRKTGGRWLARNNRQKLSRFVLSR